MFTAVCVWHTESQTGATDREITEQEHDQALDYIAVTVAGNNKDDMNLQSSSVLMQVNRVTSMTNIITHHHYYLYPKLTLWYVWQEYRISQY